MKTGKLGKERRGKTAVVAERLLGMIKGLEGLRGTSCFIKSLWQALNRVSTHRSY